MVLEVFMMAWETCLISHGSAALENSISDFIDVAPKSLDLVGNYDIIQDLCSSIQVAKRCIDRFKVLSIDGKLIEEEDHFDSDSQSTTLQLSYPIEFLKFDNCFGHDVDWNFLYASIVLESDIHDTIGDHEHLVVVVWPRDLTGFVWLELWVTLSMEAQLGKSFDQLQVMNNRDCWTQHAFVNSKYGNDASNSVVSKLAGSSLSAYNYDSD